MTDAPETKWLTQNGGLPTGNGWHESELVHYTRTDIAQKAGWQPIETVPEDGTWVVMADIDDTGQIRLAHADTMVVEMGVWYLDADTSMYSHWVATPIARTAMGGE